MKVVIDFSIFVSDMGAFGNITGQLDVPVTPQIGDSLSVMFSGSEYIPENIEFSGLFKVTDRIISAHSDDQNLSLALSEVTVRSTEEALKLMKYFELNFNLFAIRYFD